VGVALDASVPFHPASHFEKGWGAVLIPERFPRQTRWQKRKMSEKPAAHDEILGAVEFEEERLTWLEAFESSAAAWLPEIDFVGLQLAEESKPVVIGNGDVTPHAMTSLSGAAKSIISPLEVIGAGSKSVRTRDVNLEVM